MCGDYLLYTRLFVNTRDLPTKQAVRWLAYAPVTWLCLCRPRATIVEATETARVSGVGHTPAPRRGPFSFDHTKQIPHKMTDILMLFMILVFTAFSAALGAVDLRKLCNEQTDVHCEFAREC